MKKQITIIIFLFNYFFSWGQKEWVKTATPCNDELVKKTPGRWMKPGNGLHAKLSQQQHREMQNRLDAIHQFIFNIYPSPLACDVFSSGRSDDQEFGSQLEIVRPSNASMNSFKVNGTPTLYYISQTKFCGYGCGRVPNEMRKGSTEDGTVMFVYINSLNEFFRQLWLDDGAKEAMRVDGRPIRLMPVPQGTWKGYDVYYPERGSSLKMVLLHRPGILPYIPVTRKQYLERCIGYLPQFFDAMMNPSPWTIDKKEQEEGIKKMQKVKDDVLKHYQDELQATTSAGLLESPAIIPVMIADPSTTGPIFTTQAAGGMMLATENPAYMHKDLPKYIPQFMIFAWYPNEFVMEPFKAIDENFPIEKLQAMIDK